MSSIRFDDILSSKPESGSQAIRCKTNLIAMLIGDQLTTITSVDHWIDTACTAGSLAPQEIIADYFFGLVPHLRFATADVRVQECKVSQVRSHHVEETESK